METARWTPGHPLDFSSWLDRGVRRGANPTSVVSDGYLYRTTRSGAPYRIRQLPDGSIEVGAPRGLDEAAAESRFRLGETLPVEPLREVAERVPAVGDQLRRMPGHRPPINPAAAESLISSICSQQVNMRWAALTRGRLIERYGTLLELEGVRIWRFPTAERLAEADPVEIRSMQFSTRKSEYVVGAAKALAEGELDGLEDDSNEEVVRRITAVRGLGRWTAEWFLARSLARPDVIAAGDLGVRKVVSRYAADVDDVMPEPEVRAATESWGDGSNWAVHLLLERWSDGIDR